MKIERIGLIVCWYDMWIGLFWDKNGRRLYIFLVPCVGLVVQFKHLTTTVAKED